MSFAVHLDALDGINYMIHPDGTIGAVGPTRWNKFAYENNAPELTEDKVVGRNLFGFVSGKEVRFHIQRLLADLSARSRDGCVTALRCDAPAIFRSMRQAVTPIFADDECRGFLFQSIELEAMQRPPLDLYDFRTHERRAARDVTLPLVVMCSWCLRIQSATPSGEPWITAESYYAAGGTSDVRISHAICEQCMTMAFPTA